MQMHQLGERVHRITDELAGLIVRKRVPIEKIEIAPRGSNDFHTFPNGGEWGLESEWWDFRFQTTIPEDFHGRVVLSARTGRESGWEALNPQFVVRINGKIEQAFDTKHTEMLLCDPAQPGASYAVFMNGYVPPKDELQAPAVLLLTLNDINEPVRQLYYDLCVPLEAAMLMNEGEREREEVLETLARAVDMLDLRTPHSASFDRSVATARSYLQENLYVGRRDHKPLAECVGHTHIDVAWLWDLYQTRHKAVRSFSTVLKLMEQYPEYKFMSSQAVLYKFVKEDEPELYERIKQAVARGQWEVEGGMWVEADCNLAGGESLVRQFLYGQEYFTKEFGKRSRILWLPDVFGYSAALPQILKLSGIDYFMTTKISWSEFNLTPYDTFRWKGIDGSEVLAHFSPSRPYEKENPFQNGLRHMTTYNTMLSPSQVAGGWKRFQQKEIDDHFLVAYGYGDGGGGPTDWMIENARRMQGALPLTPAVAQRHALEFFQDLDQRVSDDPRLPKWSGELYLEYHRGTYTAIGKNKRNNRKIEILLRETELWCEMAHRLLGSAYPEKKLHAIWEDTLTLQFHDILPGSSIKKVYDDSDKMYEEMFRELSVLRDTALGELTASSQGDVLFFNSLSHTRDDVVFFDAPEDVTALRDQAGNLYPIQRVETRAAAFVRGLAPMTCTPMWFSREAVIADNVHADLSGFDTPFFSGSFDQAMRISSLVEKDTGRQVVKSGQTLNRIVCYENKPHQHDAWDINIYYSRRHWDVDEVVEAQVISAGPVLSLLRVKYVYQRSTITQDIYIYKDINRIDFDTHVDWREKQYMLKAHFPVDVFYNDATYDIQYGNVKRATHKNTSWDAARFEVCAHKWADVSEDDFGVSLLNDCKYGHSIDEDSMALTLLKSSTYPNPEADQEMHHFTYSVMPHAHAWRQAGTAEMAQRLNIAVTARAGAGGEASARSFVSVSNPNILVEVVKRQLDGDAAVVRVYENFGRRVKGAVMNLGFDASDACVCNLLEEEIAPAALNEREITFDMLPYEIKTFLIR